MNGKRILFHNGFLRDVTLNDETFIANLFSEPDIDFYYVRQPQQRKPKDFVSYMVTAMNNKTGLYDVICSQSQVPVGLISAELLRDNLSGKICWNIGSAVLRTHRKKGFASLSLLAYIQELTSFSINTVCLDISVDNTSSIAVAKKCGFNLRDGHGFIDPQHPEVGLRQHWYKTIHESDERIVFFQKANTAYKKKDYLRACKGFEVNGISYHRLLGTNGGIKNSTIVFVSDRLGDELRRRIENERNPEMKLVPAKLEAYRALTCSASIPVSMPRGILVVEDCETKFLSDYIYLNDECDGEPEMELRQNQEVVLDESDGYGLICPALAERWGKELGLDYTPSGMNTRFCWSKGMVFCFPFQEFAGAVANNYIVRDAWGDEVDIRNVELVMTTSMLKLWDSYDSCEHYLACCKKNGYTFGITKVCPKELESVRTTNYQFIQPFVLSDEDLEELIEPTMTEIKEVLHADWKKTVLYLKGASITDDNVDSLEDDYVKALMIEPKLIDDPYIQSSVYRLIKNRINEAKIGVLNVHGNYSIISGDPYALCQHIFGLPVTGLLKSGEIYNGYWVGQDAECLACFRAPMSTAENIRKVRVNRSQDAKYWYRYMRTNTVMNAWDTATAALNGADKHLSPVSAMAQ